MTENKLAMILAGVVVVWFMTIFMFAITEAGPEELVRDINTVRTSPLVMDKALTKLAKGRCLNLKSWSHDGSFGVFYDIMYTSNRVGIVKRYHFAGENLAVGFLDYRSMFYTLQASVTHKDNNQNPNFQKVGVFSCVNTLGTTTVILFAGK